MRLKLIFQLSIIIAVVVGIVFIDFNEIHNKFLGEGRFVEQNKECNLKESPCAVTIEDGTVLEFEIEQKDIPLMKPLTFKLKSSNPTLNKVNIKLYATNMMMGTHIFDFKNDGNGNYTAIGTLPSCLRGGMKWNADVQVISLTDIIGARYKFETK